MDSGEARTPADAGEASGEDVETTNVEPGLDTKLALEQARGKLLGKAPKQPLAVGRYKITRRLGAGGISVVFAGHEEELDREVAIKILKPSFGKATDWRDRLRREAVAMAQLSHVNIAHVYEVGEHENQPFIAMELVRGVTLREWGRIRERSVPEILSMHIQAARGLAAAHEAGLVHRDYKPDNVIVDDKGWARVLDFGLVITAGERRAGTSSSGSWPALDVTLPGTIMGTPAYMAPEQLLGRDIDPRADQFAFCVALWEALYDGRPFDGSSVTELAASIRRAKLAPPTGDARIVPKAVDEVLRRGLSPKREDRFESMDELIDALVAAQQQRERAKLRELERKAESLDFGLGSNVRWKHALAIGVVMAAIVAGFYTLRKLDIHVAGYPDAIVFGGVLWGLQAYSGRRIKRGKSNVIDRRWAQMLSVASVLVVITLSLSWLAGFPFTTGLGLTFFVGGAAAGSVTVLFDPRATISGGLMMVTGALLVLLPEYRPLWLIAGFIASYGSLVLVWRRKTAS